MEHAPLSVVTLQVIDSWDETGNDVIEKSFKKYWISHSLDGMGNSLLWVKNGFKD